MSTGKRPLFVPVAFSEDEALHLLGAARSVIEATTVVGEGKRAAPLVQAMMRLAAAADKAREAQASGSVSGAGTE